MENHVAGDLARTMAATPTTAVGEAMKDAAIKESKRTATKGAKEAKESKSENPFVKLFGSPIWTLGDRKVYDDKKVKGRTNSTLAVATFPLIADVLDLECKIYQSGEIVKDSSGTYEQQTITLSFPRALIVSKKNAVAQVHVEQFKNIMLDSYEAWISTVDDSTPVTAASRRVGRTKRVPVTE
jgi:hypothetical protein